jgi:hypothetical protein
VSDRGQEDIAGRGQELEAKGIGCPVLKNAATSAYLVPTSAALA